jgi:cob(I)alamin adenosyltransferase
MRRTSPTPHRLVSALKKNSIVMIVLTCLLTPFGAALEVCLTVARDRERRVLRTAREKQ